MDENDLLDENLWGPTPDWESYARHLAESHRRAARVNRELALYRRLLAEGHVHPGHDRVRSEFPGDVLAFLSWMSQPNDALGGATPRSVLEDGDMDLVVILARTIGSG